MGCGVSTIQRRRYKIQVEGFKINNHSMSSSQSHDIKKKTLSIIKEASGSKEHSLIEENLMETH